jgi:putative phosphoesterase
MKIGIISDTHIPYAAPRLPTKIYSAFEGVDLILHAGDLVEPVVLNELNKLAETHAVHGNMDNFEVRKALPDKRIIEIGNFKIGLTHGHGAPYNLIKTVGKEMGSEVDAIVFGHSHSPVNKVQDGILFFNPGSPTDKIFATYNSYGMLTVDTELKGEIIRIK